MSDNSYIMVPLTLVWNMRFILFVVNFYYLREQAYTTSDRLHLAFFLQANQCATHSLYNRMSKKMCKWSAQLAATWFMFTKVVRLHQLWIVQTRTNRKLPSPERQSVFCATCSAHGLSQWTHGNQSQCYQRDWFNNFWHSLMWHLLCR